MQAVADARGSWSSLVRLFGVRPGIPPPLCVYLFGSISAPVAIWWAAGVNQLPMQAALFWSIACFVPYLRTHRVRHLPQHAGLAGGRARVLREDAARAGGAPDS